MNATVENRLGIVSSLAALIPIVAGLLSYRNTQRLIIVNGRVTETNIVLAAISEMFSAIQDARDMATDFAPAEEYPLCSYPPSSWPFLPGSCCFTFRRPAKGSCEGSFHRSFAGP